MRTQAISFLDGQSLCVFPVNRSELEPAISKLNLEHGYPVIVLIGGLIDDDQATATQRAIQTISVIAEEMNAVGYLRRNGYGGYG